MNFHLCLSAPSNSLWEALEMRARSPDKFMDVSDVKMTGEDGFLSRSMMIKTKNIIIKERIWINRIAQRDHVFSICTQTLFRCAMSVSLQFERNPVCTCECPRSQAGTTAAIYRRECHSGRALTLRFVMFSVRSLSRSTERCSAR